MYVVRQTRAWKEACHGVCAMDVHGRWYVGYRFACGSEGRVACMSQLNVSVTRESRHDQYDLINEAESL